MFFLKGPFVVQQKGRLQSAQAPGFFSELLLLKHIHTFKASVKFSMVFILWKRKEKLQNPVFLCSQLRNFRAFKCVICLQCFIYIFIIKDEVCFSWRYDLLPFLHIWLLISDRACRNASIRPSYGESSSNFPSTM